MVRKIGIAAIVATGLLGMASVSAYAAQNENNYTGEFLNNDTNILQIWPQPVAGFPDRLHPGYSSYHFSGAVGFVKKVTYEDIYFYACTFEITAGTNGTQYVTVEPTGYCFGPIKIENQGTTHPVIMLGS